MHWIIREMLEDDHRAVQALATKSWHATYDRIIPRDIQNQFLKRAYHPSMLEKRRKQSLFLIALCNETIVGFANFSPLKPNGTVELLAIYVDDLHYGEGIGTALLTEGLRRLIDVRKVVVHVERENKMGRRFYEARGFTSLKEFEENFAGFMLKTIQMELNCIQKENTDDIV